MRQFLVAGVLVVAAIAGFVDPLRADDKPAIVDDMYHAVTTLRDMNSLGIAIEAYWRVHKEYPKVATAAELVKLLAPSYATNLEARDSWGTEVKYLPSSDYQDYRLISAGSDQRFDEGSWKSPGVFTDSKLDAVFSGHFIRKWAIDFK